MEHRQVIMIEELGVMAKQKSSVKTRESVMNVTTTQHSTVVRNNWGLSIAGTRITLYDIMDYLKADWPPRLIRNWLNLTEKQMADAMEYIEKHRSEVEHEYQLVLENSEKLRQYWEERNREHFAKIANLPKNGTN